MAPQPYYPAVPGAVMRGYPKLAIKKQRVATRSKTLTPPTIQGILGRYFSNFQTPAQIQAAARTQVNQQINAGLKQIADQYAQQRAELEARQTNTYGYMQALMGMQNEAAQGALQNYRDSAGRLEALGTGLTGAVGAAMNQQAAATKAAVDQATGGLGQVNAYDVGGLQNTGQYLGVTMPASTLENMAPVAADLAREGQAQRAWSLRDIANQYASNLRDVDQQIKTAQADLINKRPTLYTDLINQLTGGQRQDLATLVSGMGLIGQMGTQAQGITSSKANIALQNREQRLREKQLADQEKAARQAQIAARGYTVVNGQQVPDVDHWFNPDSGRIEKIPGGTYLKKDAKGVLRPTPIYQQKAAGSTQMTTKDMASIADNIESSARKAVQSAPFSVITNKPQMALHGGNPIYGPGAMTYKQARQALMNLYMLPEYAQNPSLRALISNRVDAALASIGYKPPAGTPKKTKPKTKKKA